MPLDDSEGKPEKILLLYWNNLWKTLNSPKDKDVWKFLNFLEQHN